MVVDFARRAVQAALVCLVVGVASCTGAPAAPSAFVWSADTMDPGGVPSSETIAAEGGDSSDSVEGPGKDSTSVEDGIWLPEDAAESEFGHPCKENSECDSGFCVMGPSGLYVCTATCLDDCPPGWLCKETPQTQPDLIFICVPGQVALCEPCTASSECGGKFDQCTPVGLGGMAFCTKHCTGDDGCPQGYACSPPGPEAGAQQCLPTTGSCECKAGVDQASRPCEAKNQYGTCTGLELCDGPKGWVGCTAHTPAPEVCNGEDDDCNGSTDETFKPEPCAVENAYGKCIGIRTCQVVGGLVCDAASPAPEACDGKDNDCDGYTDQGFLDADDDGTADCVDPDDDDDGVPDLSDDCPYKPNFDQKDTDSDGVGDACDEDVDGDGVADAADDCPKMFDPDQKDMDDDGLGDACDDDIDGDGDPNDTDCEPNDAAASMSGVETCDGKDNDCDGLFDEGFKDTDQDKLGDCIDPDDDGDGDPDGTDCKPLDPAVYSGADEACDGKDNDCDATVDEGFIDKDGNGVLDCVEADGDGDGDPDGTDCAPLDKTIHHDQVEACNGLDDDCDGLKDEDFGDSDGDGLADCLDEDDDNDGDPDGADCAPLDKTVSSKVAEACNGKDDNCNTLIDEGYPDLDGDRSADCADADDDGDGVPDAGDSCPFVKNPDQKDTDGDGSGDACDTDDDNDGVVDGEDNCSLVANSPQGDIDKDSLGDACDDDDDDDGTPDAADCSSKNPAIHPGATETCNGLDDDCDEQTDEGSPDADKDGTADCIDSDDDNDGDPDLSDCAPTDPAVSNLILESCDGKDNNCNGKKDEGFPDSDADGMPDCVDKDHDNDGDADGTDCAPTDPAVHHGALEVCNGLDDNCEDGIDEGFPDTDGDKLKDCQDDDDDNDGDPDKSDCEPLNAKMSSLVADICDGKDNNCNSKTDEGFDDTDGDGAADCVDPDDDGDKDPDESDCAPKDPKVYHGASELCDGKDNDCNGGADEGFLDSDGDGQKDCVDADDDNDGDPDKTDCAPTDPTASSLVEELCDGKDNDCDTKVDNGFPDADGDGLANCVDGDDDNDGTPDGSDNCQLVKNDQTDTDGDGDGNPCDTDDDADGMPDVSDNCPLAPNSLQEDTDIDGQGNACDTDDDGDGSLDTADCKPLDKTIHPLAAELCDGIDNNCNKDADEGFGDFDKDGLGDCVDDDGDNDGDPDTSDCAPLNAGIYKNATEVCDGSDQNCNGVNDDGFSDINKDGLADCVDTDDDGDGKLDDVDNCPKVANTDQKDTDGDKVGDVCDTDDDNDDKPDESDNCPLVANASQTDTDSDKIGDACDPDDDNDGYLDTADCKPLDPNVNPGKIELCDGIDNSCKGVADFGFADFDKDGTADCIDLDDDNGSSTDPGDAAPAAAPGSAGYPQLTGEMLEVEVRRFLNQATFGATDENVAAMLNKINNARLTNPSYHRHQAFSQWIDEQMNPQTTPQTFLLDFAIASHFQHLKVSGIFDPVRNPSDSRPTPPIPTPWPSINRSNPIPEHWYLSAYYPLTHAGENLSETNRFNLNHFGPEDVLCADWQLKLNGRDQLRHKMGFALQQIVVTSDVDIYIRENSYGSANYRDMLNNHAFDHYRDVLGFVNWSPVMGHWLSSIKNQKATDFDNDGIFDSYPDENLARENMQLFSIGLFDIWSDGTLKLNSNGLPKPTYTNDDIQEFAKIITGQGVSYYAGTANVPTWGGVPYSPTNGGFFVNHLTRGLRTRVMLYPMKMFGDYHSTGPKTFAGTTIDNTSLTNTTSLGVADVESALDWLAGKPGDNLADFDMVRSHVSTPAFITKRLIQRFTTSNPSKGYLHRAATAFKNSEGDLGLTLKQILLDPEARNLELNETVFGMKKSPLETYLQMVRTLGGHTYFPLVQPEPAETPYSSLAVDYANPDFYLTNFGYPDAQIAAQERNVRFRNTYTTGTGASGLQMDPAYQQTVFNFYLPEYAKGGAISDAGLVTPELQLATEPDIIRNINYFQALIYNSNGQAGIFIGEAETDQKTLFGNPASVADFDHLRLPLQALADDFYPNSATAAGARTSESIADEALLNALDQRLTNGLLKLRYPYDATNNDDPAINGVDDRLKNPRELIIDAITAGYDNAIDGSNDAFDRLNKFKDALYLLTLTSEFQIRK